MKRSFFYFALLLAFTFTNNTFAIPHTGTPHLTEEDCYPHGWEKLGARQVDFKTDRDEISVTGREGTFTALKIKVNNAPINVKKMIVHFRNGQKQDIALRQNIPANGESRVIDLDGNKRIITKVVFYYDTKNRARRRATVVLFGKH